jgi:hypothetical protein
MDRDGKADLGEFQFFAYRKNSVQAALSTSPCLSRQGWLSFLVTGSKADFSHSWFKSAEPLKLNPAVKSLLFPAR